MKIVQKINCIGSARSSVIDQRNEVNAVHPYFDLFIWRVYYWKHLKKTKNIMFLSTTNFLSVFRRLNDTELQNQFLRETSEIKKTRRNLLTKSE